MANKPEGVHSYGHKSMSDKGKAHPGKIGSGLQGVSKDGGSAHKVGSFAAGAKSSVPSGVVRGDGTETRRGIKVNHLQSPVPKQGSGDAGAIPGGVHKYDGSSAPKRIR